MGEPVTLPKKKKVTVERQLAGFFQTQMNRCNPGRTESRENQEKKRKAETKKRSEWGQEKKKGFRSQKRAKEKRVVKGPKKQRKTDSTCSRK